MTMPNPTISKSLSIASKKTYWNLSPELLIEASIKQGQGILSDQGALCIETGTFTGRSPKDKFIVKDSLTSNTVDWNDINQEISPEHFDGLREKMEAYAEKEELYIQDVYACADERYRLNVRVIAQFPWSCQFAHNMFKNPSEESLKNFSPEWTILCLPKFEADPAKDEEKLVLIGGSGYTGEIKKSIFSVLNYTLPLEEDVLSMHCSANVGQEGDTAIFFGLSGTGKTTLSTDSARRLIGDDEHGWSKEGVFNFEGGCYAKCINLSSEKEPDIYKAICHGAILENIKSLSQGGHPKNIFFLTCDAFGVLPPISKLTKEQAMYYFLLGYTAKVAGTETGIVEPQMTFSACFGAPFLPLAPTHYAKMLGQKMETHDTNVWLVNTGWTGGPYGVGERISLSHTRALINAVLNKNLANSAFRKEETFGLNIPVFAPGNVPYDLIDPKNNWTDKKAYDATAQKLLKAFAENS